MLNSIMLPQLQKLEWSPVGRSCIYDDLLMKSMTSFLNSFGLPRRDMSNTESWSKGMYLSACTDHIYEHAVRSYLKQLTPMSSVQFFKLFSGEELFDRRDVVAIDKPVEKSAPWKASFVELHTCSSFLWQTMYAHPMSALQQSTGMIQSRIDSPWGCREGSWTTYVMVSWYYSGLWEGTP